MKHSGYYAAYEILVADFGRACEYIEPTDANLGCYSHRLYELLLRASTEFESVCKELVLARGMTKKKPDDLKIDDYAALAPGVINPMLELGVTMWQPEPKYRLPLDGWDPQCRAPLRWYRAYNTVKHNRSTAFPMASLENVVDALGGLTMALMGAGIFPSPANPFVHNVPPTNGYVYSGSGTPIFLVRYQWPA